MHYEIKTKKLPKSEIEIEAEISAELLVSARKKAVKIFSDSMEIAGFRKGHIPENIVIEKVGEGRILEEAADILLQEHFSKIIEQEKFDIIGRPKISITKLALGNPMEFKAVFAIMPNFELPDYKKIAASSKHQASSKEKVENLEASDKEVDEVLLQIRKNKAHFDWHKAHPEDKGHNHSDFEKARPLTPEHSDGGREENLPELNDEFAKEAGNFKNLDELKEKIKENIISEKKIRNTEKTRAEIIEKILKETNIDLPEILVENEIEKSLAQFKDDVTRMGGKWEEYLEHTKKKEEDFKKDLRDSSEKRAKTQLIFNKIAVAENLEPNKEILENEIKNLKEHYPEASETSLRIYVSTLLLNQEVLKLLESDSSKPNSPNLS